MESKLFLPFLFLAYFMLPVLSRLHYPDPSPFGFLKSIQGCHKGDTVKGIRDLKLYLAHFGYLDKHKNTPNTRDVEKDHFDEELEAALKSYQVFFHLNATGELDGPTVAEMSTPRCGCPDKEIPKKTNHSLHTVSHYTLFRHRLRWPPGKTHLTYGFKPNYPAQFLAPVDRAFRKWAAAFPYFSFSRAVSFASADLKISFERGNHDGTDNAFDGRGGVLAHANPPTGGNFHFDEGEAWSIGAMSGFHDVETVALHEIGHLLGLDHSNVEDAIMYPRISSGVTKGLNRDDILGLRDLYGV